MHNLLRCRRGSTALATAAASTLLAGVVALGAEAGSWYVTKEHAQTAADAAAVAGAWRLAWNKSDSVSVAQTFATQNGFCDNCTPLPYTKEFVSVDTPDAGSVHVTVNQNQQLYLARVLLLDSSSAVSVCAAGLGRCINIRAQAKAVVDTFPTPPCILALMGSVSFQGNATVNSSTCGLTSNSTASDAINFTGNGGTVNAPSFTQGGCSDTGGNQCSYTGNNKVTTNYAPVPNPLSGLDSAMSSLTTSNFSGPCGSSLTASTSCYNGDPKNGFTFTTGGSPYNLNGTYLGPSLSGKM
jgi:Flp pilus assembly protein TadG